jgi:hypothetical protein
MNNKLREYILSQAETAWAGELIRGSFDEEALCIFVESLVLDALMDSQVALMYLKEQNEQQS